jgi:hypothetical protein
MRRTYWTSSAKFARFDGRREIVCILSRTYAQQAGAAEQNFGVDLFRCVGRTLGPLLKRLEFVFRTRGNLQGCAAG